MSNELELTRSALKRCLLVLAGEALSKSALVDALEMGRRALKLNPDDPLPSLWDLPPADLYVELWTKAYTAWWKRIEAVVDPSLWSQCRRVQIGEREVVFCNDTVVGAFEVVRENLSTKFVAHVTTVPVAVGTPSL